MGWGNPILGGIKLIRAAIQSPNYVAGSVGWSVNQDGSSEFNNVTVRGTVIDSESFIYDPSPGTGNLLASISPGVSGNPFLDQYGNLVIPGVTSYNTVDTSYATLFDDSFEAGTISGNSKTTLVTLNSAEFVVPGLAWVFPSGDSTGAKDLSNIQGQLNTGRAVFLMPGTYYVNAPIELPAYAVIRGAGRSPITKQAMTVIKSVTPMTAVFVSHGWLENTQTQPALGVVVEDLKIDGQGNANHGILLQTFDSQLYRLNIENVIDNAIFFDYLCSDGITAVTSNAPNNRIESCSINGCQTGVATQDSTATPVFTDGFLLDSIIANCSGPAISIREASGWLIEGNHLYGLSGHAMQLGDMDKTHVVNNYVESWGQGSVAAAWRAIDAFTFPSSSGGAGSIISGNVLWLAAPPGNAASSIEGMNLACEANNSASWTVTGNMLECVPSTGFTSANGIVWTNLAATCTITGVSTGNLLTKNWSSKVVQVPDGGTITLTTGV